MKKIILLQLVFLTIISHSFSQQRNADVYKGYVKYVATPSVGTVTVLCTGFAKKKKTESIKDAYSAAFYTLLFRGIPGSQYELPMISNENEKKNDPVVVSLLDKGYMSFIIGNGLESEEKKVKKTDGAKGIQTTHQITINCDALRRYLEQNNVIRKFGI